MGGGSRPEDGTIYRYVSRGPPFRSRFRRYSSKALLKRFPVRKKSGRRFSASDLGNSARSSPKKAVTCKARRRDVDLYMYLLCIRHIDIYIYLYII